MTTGGDSDPFFELLKDKARELRKREAKLRTMEAEVRVEREKLDEERKVWRGTMDTYSAFLTSRGMPVPSLDEPEISETDKVVRYANTNYGTRMGEKRRNILVFIAKATETGRGTSTREIYVANSLDANHVGNVVWMELKAGTIERDGQRIRMTPKGFEFLEQAGVYTRPPKD